VAGVIPPSDSTGADVAFDATGLGYGTYTTTLRIASNDPGEPQVDVSVVLTVTACVPVSGVDFGFAPSAPQVGQPVAFTGIVAAGETPITYIWNFDDGSGQHLGNPISHTFTTSATFTVLMTATNGCPSQATATHDVVVTAPSGHLIYLPVVVRNYSP
jgi:PKD repeat protein